MPPLLRYTGCLRISYYREFCQKENWKTLCKDGCEIFKDLDWFKTLDWGSYVEKTTSDRAHPAQIVSTDKAGQNENYFFNPAWCDAEPVYVRPLKSSFSIVSVKCSGTNFHVS